MIRTFLQNDEGMIQDDAGRWIPPIADNKDYVAAIQGQKNGDIAIVPAIDPIKTRPPAITADLIKTLITDLKKAVAVDPKLDEFIAAAATVDAEKP